jgi:hypothetical protein
VQSGLGGVVGVAVAPQQRQREVDAVAGLEEELVATGGADQRPPDDGVGVAAVGQAAREVADPPVVVSVDLHVDVQVVGVGGAAGVGAEHVHLGDDAQRPFLTPGVQGIEQLFGQLGRALAFHADKCSSSVPLTALIRTRRGVSGRWRAAGGRCLRSGPPSVALEHSDDSSSPRHSSPAATRSKERWWT